MESPTRRSQDQRRGEAEQRMLDAGVRLLALNGPEKLTLTEVGKSAGYSRGLPAHHFGSREQFLKALASHVAIEFDRTLQAVGSNALDHLARQEVDLDCAIRRARGLAVDIHVEGADHQSDTAAERVGRVVNDALQDAELHAPKSRAARGAK